MVAMKRTFFLLVLLLGACSIQPPSQLPPVVDSGSQSSESLPPGEAPGPVIEAQPENRASRGAVIALLDRAEHYRRLGDTGAASATLERALRIDPRNARLWYQLAEVRLQQGRPAQAEQLALKSNALSAGDRTLQARNWALVARARWAQDNPAGARQAERKAAEMRR
jgi:tetratricopeptide (TPR) repeat protein